jgi:DNA invertase Pin-like site-specific DNA recombinase
MQALSNPRPLRLVGYARVSSAGQALHGVSVPEQERAVREWCAVNGHDLVAIHVDNGISGKLSAEDRPALAAALLDIEADRADGLVVTSLDRLARELTHQEAALATIWSAGGRAFEVIHGEILRDDPRDPMRTFVRQVMGAAAQLEASMIRARLPRGRALKHARGGFAGGRTVPYGQMVDGVGRDAMRTADPECVAIIERIRQERAAGTTLAATAQGLNADAVVTPRGGRWHSMSVKRIAERASA